MAWMASGSCMVAMTRSRPPQRGQARTSRWNTRRSNAGQVQTRAGLAARGPASNLWGGGCGVLAPHARWRSQAVRYGPGL